MSEKKYNIEADVNEVTIREGSALKIAEPTKISISGTLRACFQFIMEKIGGEDVARMGTEVPMNLTDERIYHPKRATLMVDNEGGKLVLLLNEKDPYQDTITGSLERSEDLEDFHINEDLFFGLDQVIKVIKKNKFLFANPQEHADFLGSLMKFNARVTTVYENFRSDTGNAKNLVEKIVAENNNAPKFTLSARIYKGYKKETLEVQTCLDANANQIRFYFESVDLYELLDKAKEAAIEEELMKFNESFKCSIVHVS